MKKKVIIKDPASNYTPEELLTKTDMSSIQISHISLEWTKGLKGFPREGIGVSVKDCRGDRVGIARIYRHPACGEPVLSMAPNVVLSQTTLKKYIVPTMQLYDALLIRFREMKKRGMNTLGIKARKGPTK